MNTEIKDSKSIYFSICVFMFLLIARLKMSNNYSLFEMSCLNLLALDYVVFDVFQKGMHKVKSRLNKTMFPKLVIRRKICILRLIGVLLFGLLFTFEVIYVYNLGNAVVNDVFTIIALFLAIEDKFINN